jgi:hypothetical protein
MTAARRGPAPQKNPLAPPRGHLAAFGSGGSPGKQQRGCHGGHASVAAGKPESPDEGIRVAPPEASRIPSAHASGFKERDVALAQATVVPGCREARRD